MNVPHYAQTLAAVALATLLEDVEDSEQPRRWAEGSIETMFGVLESGRIERYPAVLRVCAESCIEHGLPADLRAIAGASLHGALHAAGKRVPLGNPLASAFAQLPEEVELEFDPLPESELKTETEGEGEPEEAEESAADPEPPASTKKGKRGARPPA